MDSLEMIRHTYREAPNDACTDEMWVALLAHLTALEERVKALECGTCRRLDTSCYEEHEGIDG